MARTVDESNKIVSTEVDAARGEAVGAHLQGFPISQSWKALDDEHALFEPFGPPKLGDRQPSRDWFQHSPHPANTPGTRAAPQ